MEKAIAESTQEYYIVELIETGEYIGYSENTTHTGTHKRIFRTRDMLLATPLIIIPFRERKKLDPYIPVKIKLTKTAEMLG